MPVRIPEVCLTEPAVTLFAMLCGGSQARLIPRRNGLAENRTRLTLRSPHENAFQFALLHLAHMAFLIRGLKGAGALCTHGDGASRGPYVIYRLLRADSLIAEFFDFYAALTRFWALTGMAESDTLRENGIAMIEPEWREAIAGWVSAATHILDRISSIVSSSTVTNSLGRKAGAPKQFVPRRRAGNHQQPSSTS
jgi:hypothetical protein